MRFVIAVLILVMTNVFAMASPSGLFGSTLIKISYVDGYDEYGWGELSKSIETTDFNTTVEGLLMMDKASAVMNDGLGTKAYVANLLVNRAVTYRLEEVEHWASPLETLTRGFGDCEDYAILKMALLLKMGVPKNDMFLVIVDPEDSDAYHAILAVRHSNGFYILDNQKDVVLSDTNISTYKPLTSMSFEGRWVHGFPTASGR